MPHTIFSLQTHWIKMSCKRLRLLPSLPKSLVETLYFVFTTQKEKNDLGIFIKKMQYIILYYVQTNIEFVINYYGESKLTSIYLIYFYLKKCMNNN